MASTIMPYDKARGRQIRERMEEQEKSAGGRENLNTDRVIIKGKLERLPIYTFEISSLLYNKANGRIAAEVRAQEDERGRTLDPANLDDQRTLGNLLLAVKHDENEKLKEDLRDKGQIEPGIITCDGMLINGNRRKALLQQLFDESNDQKYAHLEVHVLPSDITKREVWLIEAGIQLSAIQQLDYSPINHMLKLREGVNSGLTIPEMAQRIYGADEENLKEDLERLGLIDSYLRDFLNKEGRYYLVRERNEHFIDLQKILRWAKRPRGKTPDWSHDESDIAELTIAAFYYIRGRFSHLRIRDLQDIFCNRKAWDVLRRTLELDIAPPTEALSEEESEDESLDEFDTEKTDDEELDALAAVQRDREEEYSWYKHNRPKLDTHFQDAKEQQQITTDSKKPLALAQRALRNLEGIQEDSEGFDNSEMDETLRSIIARTNELRDYFRKDRKKKGKTKKKTTKKTTRPSKATRSKKKKRKRR